MTTWMKPRLTASAIAILAVVACAMPLARQDTAQQPQAGPRPLRAMTYNIHHGTGNDDCTPPPVTRPPQTECAFDLDRIAQVIREQAPDIVALQEVDRFWGRSGVTDQPALLAAALEMQPCYGANLNHNPDSHASVPHQYGTLILSKFDILECRNTFLPSTRPATPTSPAVNREQRGLLEVLVNVRGVPLRVYNTHYEHTSDFRDVRAAQINATIALIGDFEEDTILAGDLNAQPTAAEIQPLFAAFRDTWPIANPGAPGYTITASPTAEPTRRIDYLLLSPHVTVVGAEVPISPLTRMAADHYPVRGDFTLPGSHVGIGR
jgi:endonuclease/exonuclease/phosphatase family metal-dependent hydrolase